MPDAIRRASNVDPSWIESEDLDQSLSTYSYSTIRSSSLWPKEEA
jgi:hypothetical protein